MQMNRLPQGILCAVWQLPKEVHFSVISGSMNQNKPHLEQLARENSWITLWEDVNNMGEQGILFYARDARKEESLIEIIYNKLADLWMDERLCGQFRENMGWLVDGKGVERTVDKVLNCWNNWTCCV